MSNNDFDLVRCCLRHMSNKEYIHRLYDDYGIPYKQSDSYEKLVLRLENDESLKINISTIKDYHRSNWKPAPKELHLTNLKSGLLKGHNWHGAMPSMLHLSLQNKVRDHIEGKMSLSELINIGSDIMKHEYFMVCAHDLCETVIIENHTNSIPPIGSKSISDFVFEAKPYDLKITNYFPNQTKKSVNENKTEVVKQLLAGADILRLREQAKKTLNNWGLNRFYVLVEDQDRWILNPEGILDELLIEIKNIGEPLEIEIEGITILSLIIAI